MLNYIIAASGLKLFSLSPQTRNLYRRMGNVLGANQRISIGLPPYYVERGLELINIIQNYNIIQPGDRLLEIGTGWLHWESIFIRLFFDVKVILFDVWDNRQLKPLKNYVGRLDQLIDQKTSLSSEKSRQIHDLIKGILNVTTFPELYNLLGFEYIVDSKGTLQAFQSESYDTIYSTDVLEHVHRNTLPEYVHDIGRLLKPGGYSIQKIDMHDHLSFYDKDASVKNYLRYSNKVWKYYFENKVQYFNLVQRSEWLELFNKAGLELINENVRQADISSLRINEQFRHLSKQDLECASIRIVHRKPLFTKPLKSSSEIVDTGIFRQ
jgi:hypothetical protein